MFSYSSDYSVIMSSACSVLSVDRRQLPEQEKYLVACITKSRGRNLNSSEQKEEKFKTLSDTLAKVEVNLAIVDRRRWSIQSQVH